MEIFLSIFLSIGFIWNSLSLILDEKILSFMVNFVDPFGPVIVKLEPSILIEESLGTIIFFFSYLRH